MGKSPLEFNFSRLAKDVVSTSGPSDHALKENKDYDNGWTPFPFYAP